MNATNSIADGAMNTGALAPHLNGCHDRQPFANSYQVGVRPVLIDGVIQEKPVKVTNTGSRHCNYTHTELGQKDPGCTDCKHKVSK
jgi:hypothetical protein